MSAVPQALTHPERQRLHLSAGAGHRVHEDDADGVRWSARPDVRFQDHGRPGGWSVELIRWRLLRRVQAYQGGEALILPNFFKDRPFLKLFEA